MANLKRIHFNDNGWVSAPVFYEEAIMPAKKGDDGSGSAVSTSGSGGFDYDTELAKAQDLCAQQFPKAAKHKGLGEIKKYNDCMSTAVSDTKAREASYQKTSGDAALTGVLGGLAGPSGSGGASAGAGSGGGGSSSSSSTMIVLVLLLIAAVGGYFIYSRNSSSATLNPAAQ